VADAAQRELERAAASGDEQDRARLLQARVRSGDLTPLRLRVAAFAGDPAALLAFDCDHSDLDAGFEAARRAGCFDGQSTVTLSSVQPVGCTCVWATIRDRGDADPCRWLDVLESRVLADDRDLRVQARVAAVLGAARVELARRDPPLFSTEFAASSVGGASCWLRCPCEAHLDLWKVACRPRTLGFVDGRPLSVFEPWVPDALLTVDDLGPGRDLRGLALARNALGWHAGAGGRTARRVGAATLVADWALGRLS
jgi:hypothetical protein